MITPGTIHITPRSSNSPRASRADFPLRFLCVTFVKCLESIFSRRASRADFLYISFVKSLKSSKDFLGALRAPTFLCIPFVKVLEILKRILGALRALISLCIPFVISSGSSKDPSRRASRAEFPLYFLCKILEILQRISQLGDIFWS